jgi:hypothetical protein
MPSSTTLCNRWRSAAAQERPEVELDREPEV